MMQETSPVQLHQALQSHTMRESLNIPIVLWKELEPQLRERIKEVKAIIRKRKEHNPKAFQCDDKYRQGSIPPQYGNKKSTDIVAHLCSQINTDEDDDVA